MNNKSLENRIERWFRVTSPIVTLISIIVLYNMISDKSTIRLIINTLSPFLFSFLIAWLLNPLVVSLCDKFKMRRWMASLIVIVILIASFTLFIMWIVPQLSRQFSLLLDYLPNIVPKVSDNLEEFGKEFNISVYNPYVEEIKSELNKLLSKIFAGGLDVISSSFDFVGGVISSLFVGIMMFMAGIYILIDFDKFSAAVDKIIPLRMKDDFRFIKEQTNRVVLGYLRGLIIETIIVAFLAYVAFLIIGIEGALVFAVIIGITNIVPYFGPYIGAVPVAVFALTDSIRLFIIVVIVVIVVQQIDGIIIKPKVFGKTTDVHPSISIISLILFGKIFGFLGVVFAIPIAGFTIIIIKFVYNKLLLKYPEILK